MSDGDSKLGDNTDTHDRLERLRKRLEDERKAQEQVRYDLALAKIDRLIEG